MAKDVVMPVLGMNQDYGTVVRWLVAEGEAVVEGQPLLEVETDKAIVEVPAMASGVLAQVSAFEGDEVPTGTVIASLLEEGEPSGASPAADTGAAGSSPARVASAPATEDVTAAPSRSPAAGRSASVAQGRSPVGARNGGRVLATPKARRLARELSLDLAAVRGSGPGGAVRAVDIAALVGDRAASRGALVETGPGVQPAAGLAPAQVAHAAAPQASGAAAPQAVLSVAPPTATAWLRRQVDLTRLTDTVARSNAYLAKQRRPARVTNGDVLAKLTLVALATLGAPQEALGVSRGGPDGAVESRVLGRRALTSLLTMAETRREGDERGSPAVHVLDLSEMPYETSLPELPSGCRLRVALTSTPGDPGLRGALTLEHEHDPVVDPARLLTRLADLVEDPASALLYA